MKRMSYAISIFAFIFFTINASLVSGDDKGSMKSGDMEMKGSGYEHKGSMDGDKNSKHGLHDLKVTKEDMQNAMKTYITKKSADGNGVFELNDEKTGKVRRLSFVDFHEGVGMAGGHHFSCVDFKDLDSGEILDVDIYVDVTEEGVKVTEAAIHKVDGDPQFIYKDHKRMPVDHSYMKKGSGSEMKGSGTEMKGSGMEY